MSPLFEQLVEVSGLSPLFARSALQRACTRAGVQPAALTRSDLKAALPEIERTIQMFLDADAATAMRRIQELTGGR
jgi:hypothetical protein